MITTRDFVWLHHRLGIAPGDRLLDLGCAAGLALELAAVRGAVGAGLDPSPRRIAAARQRCPDADLRVGALSELPWPDASFDVVTSFGAARPALAEVSRVLVPGGRFGWAVPADLAESGRELLTSHGFVDVKCLAAPFAENRAATVGAFARAPLPAATGAAGFLEAPAPTEAVRELYDADVAEVGFVMNASRVWAHLTKANDDLFALMAGAIDVAGLSMRQRGVLVSACAAARGDSYCALMWGKRLADEAGAPSAAAVLRGRHAQLDERDRLLADWARHVVRDPNSIGPADVQRLRAAGWGEREILAITLFVALRLAFSTVNDALGARPDRALRELVPAAVRAAVSFGRPPAD